MLKQDKTLNGLRVLVTRPREQANGLCEKIEAVGGRAVLFPLLEIQAIPDNQALCACVEEIAALDIAVFISANAVHHALPAFPPPHRLPPALRFAVVGRATARALADYGYTTHLCPLEDFRSEGLLALPELQGDAVQGRRIVIFRGSGGRELLAESLSQRGARVSYVEVYRRTVPRVNLTQHPWVAEGDIDIILITSVEALRNLALLLQDPPWLHDKALLAISPRIAKAARSMGFQSIILAAGADETHIQQALLDEISGLKPVLRK